MFGGGQTGSFGGRPRARPLAVEVEKELPPTLSGPTIKDLRGAKSSLAKCGRNVRKLRDVLNASITVNDLVQVMAIDAGLRQLVREGVVERIVSVNNKFYGEFTDDAGYRDLNYLLLFNGSILQLGVAIRSFVKTKAEAHACYRDARVLGLTGDLQTLSQLLRNSVNEEAGVASAAQTGMRRLVTGFFRWVAAAAGVGIGMGTWYAPLWYDTLLLRDRHTESVAWPCWAVMFSTPFFAVAHALLENLLRRAQSTKEAVVAAVSWVGLVGVVSSMAVVHWFAWVQEGGSEAEVEADDEAGRAWGVMLFTLPAVLISISAFISVR